MDFLYHIRALDREGNTIRQSTVAYPTVEAAQDAVRKLDRIHGDDHVVCVSLEPDHPENKSKKGWKVYTAPVVDVPVTA